ncbi:sulfite exporter TauE/SafE family protein [Geodermatophilus marinus]|uniref:sulfite exporter TauE/SafE family protein n=1 Tax=Geodermatophilus sp. LHW52908 TaxID=2303986 RepID=UPI000E3DC520|nr:sulfite exporter TauE/SafE family protein [Geodermatophilus sp. LHW52908]RFU21286.1 sulfite exporter TauE/SafE family protein [Geodermatophilus sp. LHW52908]
MDWWDPGIAAAGLLVGLVVGLTGMGGGALMTPILVFFFGVSPLAAVSSDVVASFFMKPIGGLVHLRQGTVHLRLVGWLCLGSIPAAFTGVLLLRLIEDGDALQEVLLFALGAVLVLASLAMVAKAYLRLRERERARLDPTTGAVRPRLQTIPVRRPATVLVGILGGLVVGMTSVGAGSLMIVCLLLLYPAIKARQLVGTDLVQAVPLVASASVGHLLFGDFTLGLTGSILVGAIPGVWVGARVSSRSPGSLVRRALTVILLASGAKLLGAPTPVVLTIAGAAVVGGVGGWAWLKVRHGEPAFVWQQRRRARRVDGEVAPSRS